MGERRWERGRGEEKSDRGRVTPIPCSDLKGPAPALSPPPFPPTPGLSGGGGPAPDPRCPPHGTAGRPASRYLPCSPASHAYRACHTPGGVCVCVHGGGVCVVCVWPHLPSYWLPSWVPEFSQQQGPTRGYSITVPDIPARIAPIPAIPLLQLSQSPTRCPPLVPALHPVRGPHHRHRPPQQFVEQRRLSHVGPTNDGNLHACMIEVPGRGESLDAPSRNVSSEIMPICPCGEVCSDCPS